MSDKSLAILLPARVVTLENGANIAVYDRFSHKLLFYGRPRGEHPYSEAALRVRGLIEEGTLVPETLPVWLPFPHDRPTVDGLAVYQVDSRDFPSADVQKFLVSHRFKV